MNHVVCVKWGSKYTAKYVNVLKNMVARHTTVAYKFSCLTDDATDLDPEINVIKLPKDPWIKTWWSKLWMFAPEMPLEGNILYFDLDVVKIKAHNSKAKIGQMEDGALKSLTWLNREVDLMAKAAALRARPGPQR